MIVLPGEKKIMRPAICGIAGFFRLVLHDRRGHVFQDTGWFKNLVTNRGMLNIRDLTQWFSTVELGESNSAPAQGDTALNSPTDGIKKTLTLIASGTTATYAYKRYSATFTEGQSTGSIREIATWNSSNIFNHALIVDAGGSPTTTVKGADKVLTVYFEVRNYPKLTDTTGTIDISGTSYDYVLRPAQFGVQIWGTGAREILNTLKSFSDAYTGGALGATNSIPTGTNIGDLNGGGSHSVIGTGTYYNDVQMEASIDNWNHVNGIRCVSFASNNCYWQIRYGSTSGDNPIPKTDEDRLRLKIRLAWVRI